MGFWAVDQFQPIRTSQFVNSVQKPVVAAIFSSNSNGVKDFFEQSLLKKNSGRKRLLRRKPFEEKFKARKTSPNKAFGRKIQDARSLITGQSNAAN